MPTKAHLMTRAEPGSAKYLANKVKAKGLQRLKWYCQLCEKQCRDDNGFKCHTQSPGHLRKALQAQENGAARTIDKYSRQFQEDFMYLLKTSHGTKAINANKFYGQYIQEKDHIHMNATRWTTLRGFLNSLERKQLVYLSEDEYGINISYKQTHINDEPEGPGPRDLNDQNLQLEQQIKRAAEQLEEEDSTASELNSLTQSTEGQTSSQTQSSCVVFSLPKAKRRRTNMKMAPF